MSPKFDVEKTPGCREYKVNDLSQANFGRLEIDLAEIKMPGLMACRAAFGPFQPFKGARIAVSSHMTTETAVLIETLTELGAQVRWCSSNMSSTQDHAAAAIARDSASVFTCKGDTPEEYWRCIGRALDWGPGGGPHLIIDGGGDATVLIHEGVKAEEIYAKIGVLPNPSSTDNAKSQTVLNMISDGLKTTDPMRFHKMMEGLVGVSVETTTGVERLYQMQADETLMFPAINVSNPITKSKFSTLVGCPYALFDGIKRATNMTISGKNTVVCGYGDAGKVCAMALKLAGANVVVFEVDPNHALQAVLRGFVVIETLEDVVPRADIFVSNINSGNIDVFDHVQKMKNNAIIYDIDPILNLNSNMYAELQQYLPGMKRIIVNPQTDKWVSTKTNSSIIALRNTGCPDYMLSWACTSHVVAMLDLWSKRRTRKYENSVYVLAEHLEEKVSDLHLPKLIAAGMKTAKKVQAGGCFFVPIHQEREDLFPTGTDDDEPMKSDKKKMLLKGVQACSLFGLVVLGLTKASKVTMDLSFSAIWGD